MIHPLAPLALLYRGITGVRNWMFDHAWLKERIFDVPTICVGNLSVGGTGKTPHTLWIADYLRNKGHKVATLSRGYRRKTHGYREADATSTADEIGDEPLQMFTHFETTSFGTLCDSRKSIVAVCEDRCKGIDELQRRHPGLDAIVMDDAYQHRYVRPILRILLTDFSRPYYTDRVLPAGRLRESRKGAARADVIIVTKCPPTLTAKEGADIINRLSTEAHQRVFFTTIRYAPLPRPITGKVLLVTGIANPQPLLEHIATLCQEKPPHELRHMAYPDHHAFTKKDLEAIDEAARDAELVITTAKDHARLANAQLTPATKAKIVVQDIEPLVLFNQEEDLQTIIREAIVPIPIAPEPHESR